MKSSTRIVSVGVGVAAGVAALIFYLRPAPPNAETPATREAMKSSDRVRARLEQLREQRPNWQGDKDSAIHARSGVAAAPQQLGNARNVQRPGSNEPARAEPEAAAEPGDVTDILEEDPEDVPAMKKIALEDADPDRRLAAVTMLGASENPDAIPVLAQALSDNDEEVRMAALQGLSDFTDEPPVEAIANALNDPTPDIRFEALSVLADVGGDQSRAAIEKALNDPDEDVRNLAEGIMDMENVYQPAPPRADSSGQPPPAAQQPH